MYEEDYQPDWLDELYDNASSYGRCKAVQMSSNPELAYRELYNEWDD